MVLNYLVEKTHFLPYQFDLTKAEDREDLGSQGPEIKAMLSYVFYDGSDSPEFNDIKRQRAADLVQIASVILDAVMGDPFNFPKNPWKEMK